MTEALSETALDGVRRFALPDPDNPGPALDPVEPGALRDVLLGDYASLQPAPGDVVTKAEPTGDPADWRSYLGTAGGGLFGSSRPASDALGAGSRSGWRSRLPGGRGLGGGRPDPKDADRWDAVDRRLVQGELPGDLDDLAIALLLLTMGGGPSRDRQVAGVRQGLFAALKQGAGWSQAPAGWPVGHPTRWLYADRGAAGALEVVAAMADRCDQRVYPAASGRGFREAPPAIGETLVPWKDLRVLLASADDEERQRAWEAAERLAPGRSLHVRAGLAFCLPDHPSLADATLATVEPGDHTQAGRGKDLLCSAKDLGAMKAFIKAMPSSTAYNQFGIVASTLAVRHGRPGLELAIAMWKRFWRDSGINASSRRKQLEFLGRIDDPAIEKLMRASVKNKGVGEVARTWLARRE